MIYHYFAKLKAVINASPLVEAYKMKKEIVLSFVGQISIEITRKGGSVLHGFEYVVVMKGKVARAKYRYHRRDEDGLIMRWGNAQHQREIESSPFHIHTKNELLAFEAVQLEEILKFIGRALKL